MVALAVTAIDGIAVVVDNDAPPALRVLAACVSDAAASLVLLALQGLMEAEPELFAVPLVGDGSSEAQTPARPTDPPVDATDLGALGPTGGAEHMTSTQPLVYEQVQRLRGLAPLADAASVAAHFGIAVDEVEGIWSGVVDDGPRAA